MASEPIQLPRGPAHSPGLAPSTGACVAARRASTVSRCAMYTLAEMMIAAPITVWRAIASPNSHHPSKATSGNCMKLIGCNAETSPSLSARVQNSCPAVPKMPVAISHSQSIPCGQVHWNNAGINDIGTQNT